MLRTAGAIILVLFLSVGCGTFHATTSRDTSPQQSVAQATPASKPDEGSKHPIRDFLFQEFVIGCFPIWCLMGCPD